MFHRLAAIYRVVHASTRRRIPLAAFFGVILSMAEAFGIGLIFPLLLVVSDPGKIQTNRYLKSLFDYSGARDFEHFVMLTGVLVVSLFVAKNVLSIAVMRWQVRFLAREERMLANELYAHYMTMPYSEISRRNSAELIQNIVGEIATAISTFLIPSLSLLVELTVVAGIVAALLVIDAPTALGVMIFLGCAGGLFHIVIRKRLGQLGERLTLANTLTFKTLREGIGAAKEIRVLGRADAMLGEFARAREELAKVRTSREFLTAIPRYYMEIVLLLGLAIFAWLGLANRTTAEAVSVIVLFGAAGLRVLPSVNRILVVFQQMNIGGPSVDLIEREFATVRSARPVAALPASASFARSGKGRGIEVKNVHFRYPDRPVSALSGTNLHIGWGESVGLVGASGAGKSTLIDLILGLYAPDRGQILIDGRDVAADLSGWRSRVGYVPQDVFLIDDTIRRNIAFGLPNEVIDEARVNAAIRQARLDFIKHLPAGIDTMVGEDGIRLSGGQRQRIGIARALYHDPDVLILDEATSSLDNETEERIAETIQDLSGRKTLLIIAHRLSTVRRCGRITMMKDGACTADGSFDELIRTSADFAGLVEAGRF